MTGAERQTLEAAQAQRKAAKEAYEKAFDEIQPLRMAWIHADAEVKRLMKAQNVTKAATWRD